MAADKNTCVACSRKLTSKQKSLRCTSCGKRAHSKCIAWPDEELQLLRSGQIEFLCCACDEQRKPSDNIVPTEGAPSVASPRDEEPFAPQPGDLDGHFGGLRELLLNALQGISLLTDEVNALRQESARLQREAAKNSSLQAAAISSLQDEVRALRSELGRRKPQYPPLAPAMGDKATEAALTRAPLSVDTRKNLCASENASSPVSLLPATTNWASPAKERPGDTRRPVREVAVGANTSSAITSVPRRPARKALFVSRLHPDTSVPDVLGLVNSVVTDESAVCTRLKSKYPSYASFHISTSADSFAALNDAAVWPNGCLFRPFGGFLKEDRVLSFNNINSV